MQWLGTNDQEWGGLYWQGTLPDMGERLRVIRWESITFGLMIIFLGLGRVWILPTWPAHAWPLPTMAQSFFLVLWHEFGPLAGIVAIGTFMVRVWTLAAHDWTGPRVAGQALLDTLRMVIEFMGVVGLAAFMVALLPMAHPTTMQRLTHPLIDSVTLLVVVTVIILWFRLGLRLIGHFTAFLFDWAAFFIRMRRSRWWMSQAAELPSQPLPASVAARHIAGACPYPVDLRPDTLEATALGDWQNGRIVLRPDVLKASHAGLIVLTEWARGDIRDRWLMPSAVDLTAICAVWLLTRQYNVHWAQEMARQMQQIVGETGLPFSGSGVLTEAQQQAQRMHQRISQAAVELI